MESKELKIVIASSHEKKQIVLDYLGDSVINYSENARIILGNIDQNQKEYLESNDLAKVYDSKDSDLKSKLMLCQEESNDDLSNPCNVPPPDFLYGSKDKTLKKSDIGNEKFKSIRASIELEYQGKNVDVVIVDDSPCPINHPEFLSNDDNTGISRVQNIDWNRTERYRSNFNVPPFSKKHPDNLSVVFDTYLSAPYHFYDCAFPTNINTNTRYGAKRGDTHGVHVSGTACGNTHGWAKKSNIFHMNFEHKSFLNPSVWMAGEHLLNFHLNKPINPYTGRKNPTVANMSFGNFQPGDSISFIDSISYRGQIHYRPFSAQGLTANLTQGSNVVNVTSTAGLFVGQFTANSSGSGSFGNTGEVFIIRINSETQFEVSHSHATSGTRQFDVVGWDPNRLIDEFGLLVGTRSSIPIIQPPYITEPWPWLNFHGAYDPVLSAYVEDAIAAGVVVVAAAGNTGYKVDVPGGEDYDNYYTKLGGDTRYYYHRGSSPANVPGVISVGSMSGKVPEYKSYFSCAGPQVDIYAPGEGIQSPLREFIRPGYSYFEAWNAVGEPRDPYYLVGRQSGTSMASPQVAGMIACYLEKEPDATPAEAKQWIIDNGKPVLGDTNGGYRDPESLRGGTNKVAFFPYANYTMVSEDSSSPSSMPLNSSSSSESVLNIPSQISQFECSFTHTLLTDDEGGLYSWGHNNQGQLGRGTIGNSPNPVGMGEGYVSVSAGLYHSLGLKANGDLYAWGWNYYGQIGREDINVNSLSPIKIGEGYSKILAGDTCSFAIKENGDLYAWGDGRQGRLGDGGTNSSPTPKKIGEGYSLISIGKSRDLKYEITDIDFNVNLYAIKSNGDLFSWGTSHTGNGTLSSVIVPEKIGEGYSYVSAGDKWALGLKANGDLYSWGTGTYGGVGLGHDVPVLEPTFVGSDYMDISAGAQHSLAIKTNGDLYAWGRNDYGTLGDGTTTSVYSPKKIDEGYVKVKAGEFHSLALKNDGALYSWGRNAVGQLGNGTYARNFSPNKIIQGN